MLRSLGTVPAEAGHGLHSSSGDKDGRDLNSHTDRPSLLKELHFVFNSTGRRQTGSGTPGPPTCAEESGATFSFPHPRNQKDFYHSSLRSNLLSFMAPSHCCLASEILKLKLHLSHVGLRETWLINSYTTYKKI